MWIISPWSACTRSCGGGVAHRTAFCVTELQSGDYSHVTDDMCKDAKPKLTKVCNEDECPQWIVGKWSPCSRTCSVGIQMRAVVCRRPSHLDCSPDDKSIDWKPCHSGVPCSRVKGHSTERTRSEDGNKSRQVIDSQDFLGDLEKLFEESSIGRHHLEGSLFRHHAGSMLTVEKGRNASDGHLVGNNESGFSRAPRVEQETLGGSGETERLVENVEELKSIPIGENREVTTTPSFIVSTWSQCSTLCGPGIRTRRVQCQVLHAVSLIVMDLPDSSCSGPRPVESENCQIRECSPDVKPFAAHESYAWKRDGYGFCSRSCAGGIQEAVFSCIRVSNLTQVKNDRCQHLPTPYVPPQSCNEHRCPPRWRAFPSGPCSASCGGGQQLRNIRCIYDLENGDVEDVADDRCPLPKPPKTIFCNMAPCSPSWNVDSWSGCSVTCGQGIQTRQVRCEQKISLSHVATINESNCGEHSTPPPAKQPCDMGECPKETQTKSQVIYGEASSFVQLRQLHSRLPLIIGGTAVLIPETTVQFNCPVRHFNKTLIQWTKGEHEITSKGRIKVSPKGTLRIRQTRLSDAGIYTCKAGGDSASTNLTFHSLRTAHLLAQTKLPAQELKSGDSENQKIDDEGEEKYPISLKYLKRTYTLKNLSLDFVPHPWSVCSKTCGGSGLQSRDITCEVTMGKGYTLVVDDHFCLKLGKIKPIETQDCGYESSALTCPSWDNGPWQECTHETCDHPGFGLRTRSIYCVAYNGSRLDLSSCSQEFRPEEKETCANDLCQADWKVYEWGKCSISCGGRGIKMRKVECIWTSTGKPAPTECVGRPETVKSCFMPACASAEPVCRDESKYCSIIPKLHMCRYPQYRRECCYSCNLSSSSASSSSIGQQLLQRRYDVAVTEAP